MQIDCEANFQDLVKKISVIKEANLDESQIKAELLAYPVSKRGNRCVETVFKWHQKVARSYDSSIAEIHCAEMLTKEGK